MPKFIVSDPFVLAGMLIGGGRAGGKVVENVRIGIAAEQVRGTMPRNTSKTDTAARLSLRESVP